ncbi:MULTISPECIES: class C sortase [Peptoniphilus]|uniref:class C sortase n=1 Tax=Peptoniphilus TaxID=162289 RepID=UPI0008A18EC9|nr:MULTISPECIES: class C sortase [Peptoniphilus]MDU5417639.1 class C sortase [Peptoniphilus harei]MDU6743484.1 class C sortase [Peptoniphilus harei]OFO61422.1 sortase [Peptoniphilus sp. HMSC075B08]
MKEKFKRNWKIILLFITGFLIASYPIISNWYYTVENNNQIVDFKEAVDEMSQAEIDERIDLARAYNETLDPSKLADPYTDREKKGVENYARMLEAREKIGYLDVPKINQQIPVYAGTSEDVLQKACGHLEGTSLPIGGKSTHSVITAHRGLPQVKLFRDLDKMEVGDVFYYTNVKETLAYQVDQILVIEPWNFDPVLVVEGKDYMTLLTCTPYMINSHRLLVRGHRIPYVPEEKEEAEDKAKFNYKDLIVPGFVILLLIIIIFIYIKRRRRRRYEG